MLALIDIQFYNLRMGKKSDEAEVDRRVHAVAKLLASAKTTSCVLRYCA